MAAALKRCKGCGRVRALAFFSRHSGTKDGRRPKCKDCCKSDLQTWRATSPAHRDYVERNRDALMSYHHDYYVANSDQIKRRVKQYQSENADQVRVTKQAHYVNNKERIAERQREYYEQHRVEFFERAAMRRALKKATQVEPINRDVVFDRDDGCCGICGGVVDPGHWHLDHIVPLALGGSHIYANVQVSHPDCNLRKGTRLPQEVM